MIGDRREKKCSRCLNPAFRVYATVFDEDESELLIFSLECTSCGKVNELQRQQYVKPEDLI